MQTIFSNGRMAGWTDGWLCSPGADVERSSSPTSPRLPVLLLAGLTTFAAFAPTMARADDAQPPRPRQGYYVAVGASALVDVNREKSQFNNALVGSTPSGSATTGISLNSPGAEAPKSERVEPW